MGVKKDYKKGRIDIERWATDSTVSIVNGRLIIEQGPNEVIHNQEEAARLWPIVKLYAETRKIFEDRYSVRTQDGVFFVEINGYQFSGRYIYEAAAQLVCDAMNEAARMEEE